MRSSNPAPACPDSWPDGLFDGLRVYPAGTGQERPVIAVDLIGFGLSDQSVSLDYSKKAMADTIAGLMALLDYDRYDVLGHSMGGEVALHLALNHQDRVGRLILLDSAGLLTAGMPGTEGPGRTAGASPFLIDLVFKTRLSKRGFSEPASTNRNPLCPGI